MLGFSIRSIGIALWLICAAVCGACSGSITRTASELGFGRDIVAGTGYSHVAFHARRDPPARLHIYLDGDGRPWQDGRTPAVDPTPTDPLVLELMARDDAAAVYLGRPCYFGFRAEGPCTPDLWTFARYSEAVVDSMVVAANRLVAAGGYAEVVLIGYSGGGALARLMAPAVDNLRGILTVAANLDLEAWTEAHGYLPLGLSVDPARARPLPPDIVHVAVVGERDAVVPPAVIEAYLDSGQRADVWRFPEADHTCCWRELWHEILSGLEGRLAAPLSAASPAGDG